MLRNFRSKVRTSVSRWSRWQGQVGQDVFAATVSETTGLRTYIDVGAGHPWDTSNTWALEKGLQFIGIGVEFDFNLANLHSRYRKNPCFSVDARDFDYAEQFEALVRHRAVGFLSIDIDPPEASLDVLTGFPFHELEVMSLCFEHDIYRAETDTLGTSRHFLESQGFVLLADSVDFHGRAFEDWWVSEKLELGPLRDEVNRRLIAAGFSAVNR